MPPQNTTYVVLPTRSPIKYVSIIAMLDGNYIAEFIARFHREFIVGTRIQLQFAQATKRMCSAAARFARLNFNSSSFSGVRPIVLAT